MTAEIAILNRTAVALAADSVVTLAGDSGRKTYDSAEKIFELSNYQPIGLMIYNNAQYMNAPLEIIVRRYRETLTSNTFKRLGEVWPHFSRFLLDFPHLDEHELDHFRQMVAIELDELRPIQFNHMLLSLSKGHRRSKETVEQRIVRAIEERRIQAEAEAIDDFLTDVTQEEFNERYGTVIDTIAQVALSGLDLDELRDPLCRMLFALVRSSIRTDVFTGFVVAGFGTEDIFPTLYWVECDGVYFGQFRIIRESSCDIDRSGDTAAIVPFAQTDMAEQFIMGISQNSEEKIETMIMSMVSEILDAKPRSFPPALRREIQKAAQARFREGMDKLKFVSEQGLKGVVDHLSKKELAEVAYSLVELTSRKRRYSSEPETVGGPIDVAILTRNEGFIWVRRKHYFDATLNPGYFNRRK
jgi:hypothetical protein